MKKKQKQVSEHGLKFNSSREMSISPGMMNQGDLVGNRKGLLLSGTQYGATVPWGMPKLTGGTTVPVAASSPSGKAFSGCLGTNGIRRDNINTYVNFSVTHNWL